MPRTQHKKIQEPAFLQPEVEKLEKKFELLQTGIKQRRLTRSSIVYMLSRIKTDLNVIKERIQETI